MARQQDKSVLLYSGVRTQVIRVEEDTTASSYEDGDLVKFSDAGRIRLATNGVIAGIATEDATGSVGSASDTQDLELIDFYALYLITEASATATAQANVGEVYDLDFTAGGQFVDTAATGEVHIVGIYPGDLAVQGGRYIIRFNASDLTVIGD